MSCSLVKVDVHMIFHVKTTSPVIAPDDLEPLFKYINGIITNVGGILIQIGGVSDHIHILASLPKNMCVSEFVKTIKVNSSKWMKTINHYYTRFAWQLGFGAFSVSPSILDNTIRYIKNQAEHHRVKTFQEEYKMILDAYGIEYDERYIFAD